MNKKSFTVSSVLLPIALFVGGFAVSSLYDGYFPPSRALAARHDSQLVNPTLLTKNSKHYIVNFSRLRADLREISKKYPQKTYLYFVYLNNSSWIGLNERSSFSAASTVKVPLAMALYKAAEEKKLSFDQKYTIEKSDLNARFGDLYKTGEGKAFTLRELIRVMLEQSDNTAHDALVNVFARIGVTNPYDEVYGEFGWEFDPDAQGVDANEINLKTLSNMFLSLYNATYLSIQDSDEILTYLTKTPFDDKIAAGVPRGVTVSHKIGLFPDNQTYSDCGIVYAPNRNYLLCLASEGVDERKADDFMEEVSEKIYSFVINN